MEECAGCGALLAPSWKFCVHCGIAVEHPEATGPAGPDAAPNLDHRRRNRALLLGGIGIFLIGIALLVVSVVVFTHTM